MEIWADISGSPNHEISTRGRVRNKKTGHILKPFPDRYGYLRLSLGSKDNVYIHKLVAETFLRKTDVRKNQINHIDTNRENNNLSNLEWCTASENIKWGVTHGRIDPSIGLEKARQVNLKPVRIVELNKRFPSVKDCAEFLNVNPNRVSRCLVGERRGQRLHGYHIEFV